MNRVRVAVVGLRGIPDVEGGIETHCQKLYPLIGLEKYDVTVYARSPYVGRSEYQYRGINVKPMWSLSFGGVEAFLHTFVCIICARIWGAQIVHLHAIGPAFFAPLARLLGMKVVMTHHGHDYMRSKWGWFAKLILRAGEMLGCIFAHRVIAVSSSIIDRLPSLFRNKMAVIYNGVSSPECLSEDSLQETMNRYSLTRGSYILSVGRFVPEKRFLDLLVAAKGLDVDVVIAGDCNGGGGYSDDIKKFAKGERVILTGFICGEELANIFRGARLFVLASSHEGLPIALLEALSYGVPVLVSDISANLEVGLPDECYYPMGDTNQLRMKINSFMAGDLQAKYDASLLKKYRWEEIALKTSQVYSSII